jgi:phage N-6-adenine-methyltransferase
MSKINEGMMSSLTPEWGTPQEFFDELNREFDFTLDVCGDDWNAKVNNFFTKDDDGLSQPWTGSCWMNPPYGREIGKWMKKAVESWKQGATVVCLVPARTDTAWWHDYAMQGQIRFIRGRLKFISIDGVKNSAPFPSAVVIYA